MRARYQSVLLLLIAGCSIVAPLEPIAKDADSSTGRASLDAPVTNGSAGTNSSSDSAAGSGIRSGTAPSATIAAPAGGRPSAGAAGRGLAPTAQQEADAGAAPIAPGPAMQAPDPLQGAACPDGFEPQEGENANFPSPDGAMRQFLVQLPADLSKPAPVMVVLTSTFESTMQSATINSAELLPAGWIVLAPVRTCSPSADDSSQACSATGSDGWDWRAWNDGAASNGEGMMWWDDEGPDARFVKSMVQCAATKWSFDSRRLFVMGLSSGGALTHRLLTFQSDFWAGGIPASGEWYARPDNQAVAQDPTRIFTGRCCPLPELPAKLGPMFVISVWGGPTDMWMGIFDYTPSTQAASNYFASQADVAHVACSGTYGHRWHRVEGMNTWMASLLYSHPKGSTIAPNNTPSIQLPSAAPSEFSCVVGRYVDHYNQ